MSTTQTTTHSFDVVIPDQFWRDLLAGLALVGLVGCPIDEIATKDGEDWGEAIARIAYDLADDILAERVKRAGR